MILNTAFREISLYREDRPTRGGGVAVLLHKKFSAYRAIVKDVEWFSDSTMEYICVSVQQGHHKSFVICCVYIPEPKANDLENFDLLLCYLLKSKKDVFILGDLNINLLEQS